MGLVDRRPVVCRNLVMGFWVPLHHLTKGKGDSKRAHKPASNGVFPHVASKKECFSNALRHTLVVLEMH